jgi:hypothetical protein
MPDLNHVLGGSGSDSASSFRDADKTRAGALEEGRPALPSPDTKRWVVRRKAQVVAGVRSGLLTVEEACRRYNLSSEEYKSWEEALASYGERGLRTTRLQVYRGRNRQR